MIRMSENVSSYVLQKIHFCYALYKENTKQLILKFNILLHNDVKICYLEKVKKNFRKKKAKNSNFHRRASLK